MSNEGKKIRAHYRGTLDDGTQFDSSYDRGEPIEFTCGAHQMIAGFDAAVKDMAVGDKLFLTGPGGQPVPVVVVEKTDSGIKLDANHELAGKDLNFDIEIVEIS